MFKTEAYHRFLLGLLLLMYSTGIVPADTTAVRSVWPRCSPAEKWLFTPVDASAGLSDNQVRYILQLNDGRMVITTSGNLNIYNGSEFSYLHRQARDVLFLPGYKGYYRMYTEGDTLMWIKDWQKLMLVDLRAERFLIPGKSYFKVDSILDLFVDSDQRRWILTPRHPQSARSQDNPPPSPPDRFFLYNPQSDIVLQLDRAWGELQDVASDEGKVYLFFSTGTVYCFAVSTAQLLYSSAAYPGSKHDWFDRTSLVVKGEKGFYQLRNGTRGGCFFFNTRSKGWQQLLQTGYALNTLLVSDGNRLMITSSRGVWVLDREGTAPCLVSNLQTVTGEVLTTEISTVFQDFQGGLWMGTYNRGLLYYHPARFRFLNAGRPAFPEIDPLKDFQVLGFARAGELYLNTNQGVYKMTTGRGTKIQLEKTGSNQLPPDVRREFSQPQRFLFRGLTATAMLDDSRGWTWVGTMDGLALFKTAGRPQLYYTSHGLGNNFIHALIEDDDGNVWASTSFGITRIGVTGDALHFTAYTPQDGTLAGEYSDGAVLKSDDGSLYFGGMNGFSVLKKNAEVLLPPLAKPLFAGLLIRGERILPSRSYDERIILETAPASTSSIVLAHDQNFITLEFASLNFVNPHQTTFRYQLAGVDREWRTASSHTGSLQAIYTNLEPGNYEFRVQSNNGTVSEVSTLPITILTPWWKTTFALVCYIAAFILLAGGSMLRYTKVAQRRREQLQKEEMLLFRIRTLIEQRLEWEEERTALLSGPRPQPKADMPGLASGENDAFVRKAIGLVEQNMDVAGYTVEQLSRDLCMDRTGLYRKLTASLDQSPSAFIRNIRLQRAARLLAQGGKSVTEVAEQVGFGSVSYFSKCFQEAYGCRPSEYTGNG